MTTNAAIAGYRTFLEQRDGEADIYRDSLSRREAFFQKIEAEPLRSRWVPDRATFLRNLASRRPEPGLDERMIWLLATAKGNQAERFGVELGKLYGHGPSEGDDPEHIHLHLQESYHTRVLADVVSVFGLPVPAQPPNAATRAMINVMVFSPLPDRALLPLVGMSEMMGCVMFRLLRDRGLELFADEPEVVERIRLLFDEILADEICHVGLVEARLGRIGRAAMHWLYRSFGMGMVANAAPEFSTSLGRERIAAAHRRPFDQRLLAAEFPDTAYAF